MRSELFINGTRVDLTDEISIALTYAISDLKKPDTRKGSYSKTVKLPGTKTLNSLLTHIYEIAYDVQTSGVVNFTPDFNPNLKAEAVLLVDGLEQFRGYMKLFNINRQQNDLELIEYEVALIGEAINIFTALGDAKMSDLDLSEFNHTYNKTNQKATWTNTNYGEGYVYPMINYGGISYSSWDVNNFYPATYLKTYVDKIFAYAGYTYTSTFFNSAYFKRLVVSFTGQALTLTATQIADRRFSAYTTGLTSGTVTGSTTFTFTSVLVHNAETSDPSNQHNTTTGVFTAAESGYYGFVWTDSVFFQAVTNTVNETPIVTVRFRKNGSTILDTGTHQFTAYNNMTAGDVTNTVTLQLATSGHFLSAGETVDIFVLGGLISGSITGNIVNLAFNAGSTFYNTISSTAIFDGNDLDMASTLPIDTRQADVLMAVLKTWNMYMEPDKNNPNNLLVDTDADFYGAGTTRDWTHKLDVSKPVVLSPMGALDARRYVVTYSEDGDFWNKYYADKWKEIYGERHIDVINDFLTNTNENKVLFAATPLIGNNSNDRIIPEIYALSSSGTQTSMRSKMRVLYWAGPLPTANSWTYTSTVSGSSTENTYPYAGHLDNPYSPTIDLSFGVPREIYFVSSGITTYTTDNIYNRYHSQYVSEITDRNSKIVTGYFRLRPLDILTLSFRDSIYIDGHYFRLQRIIDYNPVSEGVTKVELLKIKAGVPFMTAPTTGTIEEAFVEQGRTP